jgi:hypothetical protein
MFHDRDCWGDAPVSSHGHARPSIEVLKETPRLLFENIRNWDTLKPLGDVAVIYDLIQHQHTSLGDPMPSSVFRATSVAVAHWSLAVLSRNGMNADDPFDFSDPASSFGIAITSPRISPRRRNSKVFGSWRR